MLAESGQAHSLRDVNRRVIGLFLVLLLLGAGAGYALAAAADTGAHAGCAGPTAGPRRLAVECPTAAPRERAAGPRRRAALGTDLPVETVTLQDGRRSPGVELASAHGLAESHTIAARRGTTSVRRQLDQHLHAPHQRSSRAQRVGGRGEGRPHRRARQAESDGDLSDFAVDVRDRRHVRGDLRRRRLPAADDRAVRVLDGSERLRRRRRHRPSRRPAGHQRPGGAARSLDGAVERSRPSDRQAGRPIAAQSPWVSTRVQHPVGGRPVLAAHLHPQQRCWR